MIETKARKDLEETDVLEKAKAAVVYCEAATAMYCTHSGIVKSNCKSKPTTKQHFRTKQQFMSLSKNRMVFRQADLFSFCVLITVKHVVLGYAMDNKKNRT